MKIIQFTLLLLAFSLVLLEAAPTIEKTAVINVPLFCRNGFYNINNICQRIQSVTRGVNSINKRFFELLVLLQSQNSGK